MNKIIEMISPVAMLSGILIQSVLPPTMYSVGASLVLISISIIMYFHTLSCDKDGDTDNHT